MSLQTLLRDRRGLVFAVPAGALAVLVVVAALNLDSGSTKQNRVSRIGDAEALLAPRTATTDELSRASNSVEDQASISLASGAWIQVADETGRLAQQYSATKLDPMPGSQLAMTEPRAMMYMKDGRVLVLSSRKGVAFAPRRALESGTLEEDVVVRLFKPARNSDGKIEAEVDVDHDIPAVVITAEQAQFDGILGEVRCDKAVRVATEAGSFAGEGLSLVLDADGDGLERLVVERATEPIRIDRAARAMAAKRSNDNSTNPAEKPDTTQPPAIHDPSDVALDTKPKKNKKTKPDASFYRLVLSGGVEIVRVRRGEISTVKGDELVAIFNLESHGIDDVAFAPTRSDDGNDGTKLATNESIMHPRSWLSPRHHSATLMAPTALTVSALAFAQPQVSSGASTATPSRDLASSNSAPDDGDSVTVTFGGRLVMLPAIDPDDQLAHKDDIRFDVIGPRVELLDGRSSSRITCSRLRYSVRDERVEAEGREGFPLRVTSPRMQLEGSRFWANLSNEGIDAGKGRLEGAGSMAFSRADAQRVSLLQWAPMMVVDASRMLVSADPGAVLMVQSTPPATEFRFDPSTQDLEIKWTGGVDLRFTEGGDQAKLSLARFEGGVNVFGRQFEMDAASLEVAFAPDDSQRIDAIIADGGTKVRRLGGEGSMNAERLELFLGTNSAGDPIPRRLVARTAVEARDARQVIWTEDLVVGFREKVAPAVDAAIAANSLTATGAAFEVAQGGGALGDNLGDIDIESVHAKGGVQILLKEGARVFAQELIGDASKRKLRLTGDNVAIVRTNVVADNLRDLRFDDATRSARSEGPGRFRVFREPLTLGEGKVERPNPQGRPSMEASWSESLDYSEVAETRGNVDIRGDVKVRSRPSDTTSDAIDAQSILLELGIDPKSKGAALSKDAVPHGAAGSSQELANAERSLDHFIAKGGARLESRTFATAERVGEPRVFRVSGEHIEYDLRTREGLVVGDGGILVNMPKSAQAAVSETAPTKPSTTAKAQGSIALGADGTTRFRWKERMAIEHQYDDVFKIVMQRDVELLHAGLRVDDTMSMRCDTLEAMVKRPLEKKDSVIDETGASGERGVDLGGPAEMLSIKGSGAVIIRTAEQDIECGEFDYSLATGIATLTAAPGRTVTVAMKGQPSPIRAQQMIWDLRNGRLQVSKVSGVGAAGSSGR